VGPADSSSNANIEPEIFSVDAASKHAFRPRRMTNGTTRASGQDQDVIRNQNYWRRQTGRRHFIPGLRLPALYSVSTMTSPGTVRRKLLEGDGFASVASLVRNHLSLFSIIAPSYPPDVRVCPILTRACARSRTCIVRARHRYLSRDRLRFLVEPVRPDCLLPRSGRAGFNIDRIRIGAWHLDEVFVRINARDALSVARR